MNAARFIGDLQWSEGATDAAQEQLIQELCTTCNTVMDDDFNAPKLVANLHEMATQINIYYNNGKKVNNISKAAFDTFISTYCAYLFDVLGLQDEAEGGNSDALDKVMQLVIDIRKQARDQKDWATSDKIRDGLKEAGIVIKDSKEGTTYEVN